MKVNVTRIDVTNPDNKYIFDGFSEKNGPETKSEIYKIASKEYSRCTSKIYVDRPDGKTETTGWVFLQRTEIGLVETWVEYDE